MLLKVRVAIANPAWLEAVPLLAPGLVYEDGWLKCELDWLMDATPPTTACARVLRWLRTAAGICGIAAFDVTVPATVLGEADEITLEFTHD